MGFAVVESELIEYQPHPYRRAVYAALTHNDRDEFHDTLLVKEPELLVTEYPPPVEYST